LHELGRRREKLAEFLAQRHEEKRSLGKPKYRWQDTIETYLK
jgi:hypothetical protein